MNVEQNPFMRFKCTVSKHQVSPKSSLQSSPHRQRFLTGDDAKLINTTPKKSKNYSNCEKTRYNAYWRRAIFRRKCDWELTFNQCVTLFNGKCKYCDFRPEGKLNGIDRVDSTKGYTIDNVVSCCSQCNYAKGTLTESDFLKMCSDIVVKMESTEVSKFFPKVETSSKNSRVPLSEPSIISTDEIDDLFCNTKIGC